MAKAKRRRAAEEVVTRRVHTVDEIGDPLPELGEEGLFLRLRDPAGGNCGLEPLLRTVDQRADQAIDGLALLLCDLGERLTALELRSQLVRRDAENDAATPSPRKKPRCAKP
jgi:hypothetical protein